nr:hypothetical protein [Tanacetum cinerariifolium]
PGLLHGHGRRGRGRGAGRPVDPLRLPALPDRRHGGHGDHPGGAGAGAANHW